MEECLNASVLGTRKYWEDVYLKELQNFNDHGDVGEVWFGELVSKKIVKWITEKSEVLMNDNIIDIGCGNGILLMDLYKRGYNSLYGIDYSQNAINLAVEISKKENCNINFRVGNILDGNYEPIYRVVLDKGTFDAISLDPVDSKGKMLLYCQNIQNLLKENGFFLITSCNWTESELKQHFNCLDYVETLPSPVFTFGGRSGKTVTSLVFKKKEVSRLDHS